MVRKLKLSVLLTVLFACIATVTSCTPGPPPPRFEMWGDSIGFQAQPYVNFFFSAGGKAVPRTHTFPGSALCDWLPDIRRELDPRNPAAFHPQALILEFTGVGYTSCMRDARGVPLSGQALINKYASDAAIAVAIAKQARVPVYFVSTPINRDDAARYVGRTPLGAMFATLPAKYPGGQVRFIDAGLAVLWHGRYTDTLPALPSEKPTGHWPDGTPTVIVREADGKHFCPAPEVSGGLVPYCGVPSPGAMRYAMAITGRVRSDFRLG